MEKEVMGKEEEDVGAGRLVIRSLCCLAGTGSNSLISKLCLVHEYESWKTAFLFSASAVSCLLYRQRI